MRVVAAIRAFVERMLPWYDPEEAVTRRNETERVRRRSVAARLAVEDVVRRYERFDKVVRR